LREDIRNAVRREERAVANNPARLAVKPFSSFTVLEGNSSGVGSIPDFGDLGIDQSNIVNKKKARFIIFRYQREKGINSVVPF
jgi:hypothetical protein